jgi:hypothetical protein
MFAEEDEVRLSAPIHGFMGEKEGRRLSTYRRLL